MRSFSLKPLRSQSGMTILESLVAMLVLGIATAATAHLIVTGDAIAGRRSAVACAAIIAKNEAERLRTFETSIVLPKDTEYECSLNGIDFKVSRSWLQNDTLTTNSPVICRQYSITVIRKNNQSVSLNIRVLQGFYGEPTH